MPGEPALRLFVALWPPATLQQQVARWRDDWLGLRTGAPVAADKLHVTLHFLGATPAARLAELQALLPAGAPAFDLEFGRVERWHGLAVLRPLDEPPGLIALHALLGERLRALGLPVESRPFEPHLTLARKLPPRLPPAPPLPALRWRTGDPVLVRSDGGRYTVFAPPG